MGYGVWGISHHPTQLILSRNPQRPFGTFPKFHPLSKHTFREWNMCIGPVAKTDNVAIEMASRNLRSLHPAVGKRKRFCLCLGNQRSAAFAMSFIFLCGDAKHLVSNQARLQEIAEMTESRQIDNAARSRF